MQSETIHLDQDPDVTLTTYLHHDSEEMPNVSRRPGILIFPGGGYHFCSDREAEPIALAFMVKGFNAFVLRYSVKEKAAYPQPLHDAEAALRMIRERAEEWRVIPERVAVIGFSAGGHLAAMLATSGAVRPDAVVLMYAVIHNLPRPSWQFPVPQPDAATPPAFIVHTFEDPVVPVENALQIARQLDERKIPFECHIYSAGRHGLSLGTPEISKGFAAYVEPQYATWLDLCATWLQRVFEGRVLTNADTPA